MEEPLCAICQKPYRPRRPNEWFCNECYTTYKEKILSKEPWITICINTEKRRREQDFCYERGVKKAVVLVYGLGSDYDIYQKNTGNYVIVATNREE